jgi:hypothetical protein
MASLPTKKEILNRIDDPGGCRVIIEFSDVIEYCPNDEYHPWSGTCLEHTPPGYPYFPAFHTTIHPERIKYNDGSNH